MLKNKRVWGISALITVIALSACQPKNDNRKDAEIDQSSHSEAQLEQLSLQGETERVPVIVAECEDKNCPEITIDRLQTNQFVLDSLIDQAILKQLSEMLDYTDSSENTVKNDIKKQKPNEQNVASEAVAYKTAAQLLADQIQPYVNKFLALDEELKSLGAGHQISLSISPKILNSDGALATVVLNTSSYLGGAHGASSQTYYNFDLKAQKQVELDQIISDNQKAKLNSLAYDAFKTWVIENKLADNVKEYEQSWKFSLSSNYYLGTQGLILQYAEYELGPYVVGLPRLTIPYTDLKNVIKPEFLPKVAVAQMAEKTSPSVKE